MELFSFFFAPRHLFIQKLFTIFSYPEGQLPPPQNMLTMCPYHYHNVDCCMNILFRARIVFQFFIMLVTHSADNGTLGTVSLQTLLPNSFPPDLQFRELITNVGLEAVTTAANVTLG